MTAGPGGAMTDEVGIITGDLTIVTTALPQGRATVAIQYLDAEEWYTLTGSPTSLPDGGLEALHAVVLDQVRGSQSAEVPR
ncbi:hypothetical protein [Streptomyces sp. NPDC001401]|uniref:hypothetical protein n=1 Tax=Streptomyces sp. NPDC001401 TaxID=3364570 RepID=UPI00369CA972